VLAVLGYCVGAVFASPIAAAVAGAGPAPAVVLVDPEPPTAASVVKNFSRAAGQFRSFLSGEEWAKILGSAERLAGQHGDFRGLGIALVAEFRAAASLAFHRAGVLPDVVDGLTDELTARFAELMSYNVAAFDIELRPEWTDVLVIRSAGPDTWPTPAARQVRFEVDHAEILRTEAVADLVSSMLSRSGKAAIL
jgi:hypothetical protein